MDAIAADFEKRFHDAHGSTPLTAAFLAPPNLAPDKYVPSSERKPHLRAFVFGLGMIAFFFLTTNYDIQACAPTPAALATRAAAAAAAAVPCAAWA